MHKGFNMAIIIHPPVSLCYPANTSHHSILLSAHRGVGNIDYYEIGIHKLSLNALFPSTEVFIS